MTGPEFLHLQELFRYLRPPYSKHQTGRSHAPASSLGATHAASWRNFSPDQALLLQYQCQQLWTVPLHPQGQSREHPLTSPPKQALLSAPLLASKCAETPLQHGQGRQARLREVNHRHRQPLRQAVPLTGESLSRLFLQLLHHLQPKCLNQQPSILHLSCRTDRPQPFGLQCWDLRESRSNTNPSQRTKTLRSFRSPNPHQALFESSQPNPAQPNEGIFGSADFRVGLGTIDPGACPLLKAALLTFRAQEENWMAFRQGQAGGPFLL